MKIRATILLVLLAFPATALAATEDFSGTFQGTDTREVHGCLQAGYNGTSSDPSWVLTEEVKEGDVSGKGSNASGEFTVEGRVKGNTAKGVMTGVNKWNMHWQAEFSATVEGDTLKFQATGTVGGGSGCKFNSDVVAKRG